MGHKYNPNSCSFKHIPFAIELDSNSFKNKTLNGIVYIRMFIAIMSVRTDKGLFFFTIYIIITVKTHRYVNKDDYITSLDDSLAKNVYWLWKEIPTIIITLQKRKPFTLETLKYRLLEKLKRINILYHQFTQTQSSHNHQCKKSFSTFTTVLRIIGSKK